MENMLKGRSIINEQPKPNPTMSHETGTLDHWILSSIAQCIEHGFTLKY